MAEELDRCDRCEAPVAGEHLWMGWNDLTAAGFDGVCDKCWSELAFPNPA